MQKDADNAVKSIKQLLVPDKKYCCGCGACAFICPMQAITMMPDEEGFPYPEINIKKCITCQRCISICAFKADMK